MTREEAIDVLKKSIDNTIEMTIREWEAFDLKLAEAIDMAIEALTEPKTIIGIDIPYGSDKGIATIFKGKDEKLILEEVKEIMSVVRCKDCRWWYKKMNKCNRCPSISGNWGADDFCSYGERKEP